MKGWKLLVLAIALLVPVAGIGAYVIKFSTPGENPALSYFFIALVLAAIVVFTYFVAKPVMLGHAKRLARDYCRSGEIKDPEKYDMLCRRLAQSGDDPEAARLSEELGRLKEKGKEED